MKKTRYKVVHLKPWEDLVGVYKGTKRETFGLSLFINNFRIDFTEESKEAEILEKELAHVSVGQRISVLRTDDPTKPIVIRKSLESLVPGSERLYLH